MNHNDTDIIRECPEWGQPNPHPPRPIGGDFKMRLREMDIHAGKRLEVMVIEFDSGRAVGLYRLREIPDDGEIEFKIPGIIDTADKGGIIYTVEFYADEDDDQSYDDLPVDHTWVLTVESTKDGVDVEFTHGTNFENLDYQFDFEL